MSMSHKSKELCLSIITSLFILLFVYAAFSKIVSPRDFVISMNNQPIKKDYLPFIIFGLPALEILATALLFFKRTRVGGFLLSEILLLLFTAYILLIKLAYFDKIPCSCGGIIKDLSWTQHLYLNLFFVILGTFALVLFKKEAKNKIQ